MRAPEGTFRHARRLRREMTLPEVILWQALRKGWLAGLRFRRQYPIGPNILDFYCAPARLAIEVDGLVHDAAAQVRHDERRDGWLAHRGVTVLRVRANDVLRDEYLEAVLLAIEQAAGAAPLRRASRTTSPASRGRCPIMARVRTSNRDQLSPLEVRVNTAPLVPGIRRHQGLAETVATRGGQRPR